MKTKRLLPTVLALHLLTVVFLIDIQGQISGGLTSRLEMSTDVREHFEEPPKPQMSKPNVNQIFQKAPNSKVSVEVESLKYGAWKLTFGFPEDVKVELENDDEGIYIKFNQGIDSADLIVAQEKLGYLIKRFSNGFNSLLLLPQKPVFFNSEVVGNIFILEITPDWNAPLKETRTLKIAQARLLMEERSYNEALRTLDQLLEEYPGDKDVLFLISNVEGLLPRWQNQVTVLADLRERYPLDEDLYKSYYDAYTPHKPYLQLFRQAQRTVGLAAVQLYNAQLETIVYSNPDYFVYAGAQNQLWIGHIAGIINNKGQSVGFLASRNQENIYVRKEWSTGSRLGSTIYAQDGSAGLSIQGGRLIPGIQGNCAFIAAWHRPYWAIFETLAYRGREDLIRGEISSVCNRYFSCGLALGSHRVGIRGTPKGFTSVLLNGQAILSLLPANPVLAINYSLDAEYIVQQKVKVGIDGNKYNPVPYTSFENHTIRGDFIYQWRDRFFFAFYGGETFNRLGLNDYTWGISLKYVKSVPRAWDLELSANRFPSTIVSGAVAQYFTANFTIRF